MQERIPQSIAKRFVFKAFLVADHVTAAGAALTIPVQISKNGAGFANLATPANATSVGSGWYYIDLAIADTGTLGPLIVRGTEATIDPVELICEVVAPTNAGFTALPAVVAGAASGLPLKDASNFLNVANLPAVAAGGTNGLLISGSNTGTTTFGALTVTGATTLTGAVSLGSTLGVTGAVTFSSTLATGAVTLASAAITGALSVGTTTTLTGAVSLGSTLGITGAVTLSSTLATGAVTFASAAVTGALSVGGTTTLTGAVSAPAGIAANITGNLSGTVGAVTTLTNLPAVTADWLTAAGVKADAVTKIQNGLATPTNITAASGVSLAASQHVIVDSGTVTTLTGHTAQTGDSYARLGAPAGASVSADIATLVPGSATNVTFSDTAVNIT